MSVTESTDLDLGREILTMEVREAIKGKMGLLGSILATGGAVAFEGSMPESGRDAIGKTVRIPYWGWLGEFAANAEGSSPTPMKVGMTYEDATVARASLAFETSAWAKGLAAVNQTSDPFRVASEQAAASAKRYMDRAMLTAGHGSPLVSAHYSATVPHYLNYFDLLSGKAEKLGDEDSEIVAMAVHSLVAAEFAAQADATGRPLLTAPQDGSVQRIAGIPVIMSDRMPLNGSTAGTTYGPFTTAYGSSAGSGSATSPTIAVKSGSEAELGPWRVVIEILSTGELGTATFRFSTDGGNTWSAALTTGATGVAKDLTDTATDSLVGNNGKTGLTLTMTSGAGDDVVDGEFYWATMNLCCESQIWLRGAGAYWYNEAALELLLDRDILEHTDIGAMHLYGAPHVYRRRVGGTRPGVMRFTSNVRNFIG